MAKFSPPSEFDFTKSNAWPEWKQRFVRYRVATKLTEEEGEIQVSALVYAMGPQAETVFNSFQFDPDPATAARQKKDFDLVLGKFDSYFQPKRNIIHERAVFHQRVQKQGETAENFIRSLYQMAETCDFGALKEESIRDRIVVGITDRELSNRLQVISDLTLETTIQQVRQAEMVKTQNKSTEVDAVRRYQAPSHKTAQQRARPQPRSSQSSQPSQTSHHKRSNYGNPMCNQCGYRHGNERKCPAIDGSCRKCGRKGHFARRCRTKQLGEVAGPDDQASSGSTFFIGSVDTVTCKDRNDPPWTVDLKVFNVSVNFKVDSGADVSVINMATYRTLNPRPPLQQTEDVLRNLKMRLSVAGKFAATSVHNGQTYVFDIYVIDGLSTNLLSRGVSRQMGLITSTLAEITTPLKPIGLWDTDPVRITLKEGVEPYQVHTSRRVPLPLRAKVDAELKRMEDAGVIQKVTEPTDWCAPMVATLKKNGQVRLCVDLRMLNRAVRRERFILPTLEDITAKMAGASVFSTLDITSGYHQVPLHPDSYKLTTFITPGGHRYCFKRLPFGISSASEIFQRKMHDTFSDIPGVEASQDDLIVYGRGTPEHDQRLKEVKARAAEKGIVFNKDKCRIRQPTVGFLGERFGKDGMSPDPEKVTGINEMPAPTDVTGLRRIMGMVNYLGKYVADLAHVCKPMTDLLKADVEWNWGPKQEEAFSKVKQLLVDAPTLVYYDHSKLMAISADASSYGLGAVLWQMDGDGKRPVAYASRTLTDTEKRYAQIEKELLAVVWACEKFHRYVYGLEFRVMTDHKPLVPLINGTDLDKVPLRCQRLLMRLMRYSVTAEHVPGKDLVVADTLSRSPRPCMESYTEQEVELHVEALRAEWPASDAKLAELRTQTRRDAVLQEAIRYTLDGWPNRLGDVSPRVREFHNVRAHLSVADGLLLYDNRIVIPSASRADVLGRIHEGHQGITKCRERAATGVWWPGLTKDISDIVGRCGFCQIHKTAQHREPLALTPLPEGPWEHIAMDMCDHNGNKYLVVVDFYSRYIEIANLHKDSTTDKVITALSNMFARWGNPLQVTSDNGPQFASDKFKLYAERCGFTHTTSSPHYHQGNGEAERAVQTVKKFLEQEDPVHALAVYRATPIYSTGYSPAEMLMGRQPRTGLPMLRRNQEMKVPDARNIVHKDQAYKEYVSQHYDQHHNARPLPVLAPGDPVRIKTDEQDVWSSPSKVVNSDGGSRSYTVETPTGRYRRNRRHIQACPEPEVATPEDTQPEVHMDTPEPRRSGRVIKPIQRLDL